MGAVVAELGTGVGCDEGEGGEVAVENFCAAEEVRREGGRFARRVWRRLWIAVVVVVQMAVS